MNLTEAQTQALRDLATVLDGAADVFAPSPFEPTEAPEGTKSATGRTGTNLDEHEPQDQTRVDVVIRDVYAVREPDGFLRINVGPATAVIDPDAHNVTVTPAELGWTVLGEGQVAVDRDDLEWMRPREMSYADRDEFSTALGRLMAALDGGEQP